MSSTTPSIYTGKEILVAYYNKKKNLNLSVADVEFGIPERLDSPGTLSNTSVRLFHKLGVPYIGSPKLYYDRIHVSFLGTITIEKGNSVRLYQLLPAINQKYSINITEEDVEDEQLGSIGTGEILVNFKIKPTSVTYYDGDIIYTPNYPDPNTGISPEIDVYGYWDEDTSSDNVVITNDALTAQMDNHAMALCKVPVTSGKAFWEVEINETGLMVGVAVSQASVDSTTNKVIGMDEYSWGLDTSTGKIWHKGVGLTYCPPIPVGSVVGIMLDVKGGILTFMVGNTIYNIAAIGFEQYDEVYPAISGNGTSQSKGTANFGQNPIRLTPPVDYARGVFTMKTVIPSTPGGGGGGDYPPAGTVFALYCKGLDRWGVFANGEGGATDVLVQTNSTACGAIPSITATISNTPTSVTIVKGNIVETVYTLSNPVEEVAEFDTLIEYVGNANNTYHDAPRVKIGNGAYTNIVDNRITLPAGDDRFTVRMTISAGILPLVGDGLHFKLKVNDDYAALITTTGYLDFKINVQNSSIPPEGMLLHTYCNGFDKIGVYADGLGGSYERTIETNSEECGYVPFVTRQVVLQGEGTVTFPFETSEVKVTATQTPLRRKYYGIGSVVDTIEYFDLNTKMEVNVSEGGDTIASGAIGSFVNGTHFIYINTYRYVGGNDAYRPKLGRTSDLENVSLSYPFSFNPDLVYVPEVIVGDSSVLLTLVKDPRKDQSQGDYRNVPNTHIAYSKNGGDTWNIVSDGFFCYSPNINSNIRLENHIKKYGDVWVSIHSLAGTYKVGDSSFSGGGLSVSTDGENWSVKTLPIIAAPGDGENSSIDDRIFPFGSGWVLVIPSTGPQGGYRLEIFYTEDFDTFTQYPNRQWSGLNFRDNITVVNDRVYFSDSLGSNTVSYTDNLTDWYELPLTLNVDNYGDLYISSGLEIYNFFGKLLTSPASFKRISPPINVSAPLYADADGTLKIVGKDFIDISSSSITKITLKTRVGSTVVFEFEMFNNNEYVGLLETTDGYQSFHKTAIQFGNNADRYNPKLNFGGDRIIVGDRIFNFKPLLVTDSGVYPTKSQTYSVNGSFVRITPTAGVPQVIETTHQIDNTRPFVIDYSTLTYSKIQVEFIGRKVQYPNAGVELSQICDANFSVVKRFTNGNNGSYSELVENNSPECGYNADTLKTLVVSDGQQYMIPIGVKQITFRGHGSKLTPAQFKVSDSLIPLASYEVDVNRDKTFDLYGVVDYKKIISSMIPGNYLSIGPYFIPYISTNLKDWTQIGNGSLISNSLDRAITNGEKVLLFKTGYLDKDLNWNNYRPFLVNTTYANNLFSGDDDLYNRLSVKVKIGTDFYWVRAFSNYYSNCEVTKLDKTWDNFSGEPWVVIQQIPGIFTADISGYYWESNKLLFATTRRNYETYKTEDIIVSVDFTNPANITVNKEVVTESKYGYPKYFGRFNGKLMLVYNEVICERIETNLNTTSGWNILFVFPKYMTINQPTTVVNTNMMFRITYVESSTISPGYWWTTDGVLWNHNKFEEVVGSLIAPKVFIPDLINDGFLVSNSNQTVEGYKLYRTYSVNPGDLYKYQDELPGNVTQLAIENHYYEFPGSATEADPVVTEYVLNVDITEPTPVIVNIPPGGYVSAEFYMVDDGSPAAGTELETFCSGYTKNKRYANGVGGSYVLPTEFNSPDCGYVEPILTATITSFPNTITYNEGRGGEFYISLSKSLPNPVGFLIDQQYTGIIPGLLTLFEYTFDRNTWIPVETNNQEIVFDVGTTQAIFRLSTEEVGLSQNATIRIELINQLNPQHISENNTVTNITISRDTRVVQPTYLSQTYMTNDESPQLWLDKRMFELSYDQLLASNEVITGGVYEVEIYTDNPNFCVGVGLGSNPTRNGGALIYPGIDQFNWGFTSGKAWNGGTSTSYGDPWEDKTVAIRIDLKNLKLGITLNGVYQGDVFTGEIVDAVKLYISMNPEVPGEVTRGIINFGQIPPKFPPPLGVRHGFGRIVEPNNYVPEVGMSGNTLTITELSSYNFNPLIGDPKGSFITPSATTITTADKMSVGSYFWQVVLPNDAVSLIGIAGDGYDPGTLLGIDENSWAIKSDWSAIIHQGGSNAFMTARTSKRAISLEFSLVTRKLRIRDGQMSTALSIPDTIVNPYPVVQSPQAGILGINVGHYPNGEFSPQDTSWLGIGTPLVPPLQGMFLTQYCQDVNIVGDFANGNGGIITNTIKENAMECGYVDENSLWNHSTTAKVVFKNQTENSMDFTPGTFMVLGVTDLKSRPKTTYFGEFYDENIWRGAGVVVGQGLWIGIAYKDADYNVAPGSTSESIAISMETGVILHNGVQDDRISLIVQGFESTKVGTIYENDNYSTLGCFGPALEYDPSTNTLWLVANMLTADASVVERGKTYRIEIPFKLTENRPIVPMIGYTNEIDGHNYIRFYIYPIFSFENAISRNGSIIKNYQDGEINLKHWRGDLLESSMVSPSDQDFQTDLLLNPSRAAYGIISKSQADQSGIYYFEIRPDASEVALVVGVVLDSPDNYWSYDYPISNPDTTVLWIKGVDTNTVSAVGVIDESLNGVTLAGTRLGFEYDTVNNTLTIVRETGERHTFNTPVGVCAAYLGVITDYVLTDRKNVFVNLGQTTFEGTPPPNHLQFVEFYNKTQYWRGKLVNQMYYGENETTLSDYDNLGTFTLASKDSITIGQSSSIYAIATSKDYGSLGFVGFAKTTTSLDAVPGSTSDQVIISYRNDSLISGGVTHDITMPNGTGNIYNGLRFLMTVNGMTGEIGFIDYDGNIGTTTVSPFSVGDEICVIAGNEDGSTNYLGGLYVNFGQIFFNENFSGEHIPFVGYTWNDEVWTDPKGNKRVSFDQNGQLIDAAPYCAVMRVEAAEYPFIVASSRSFSGGSKYVFEFYPSQFTIGLVPSHYNLSTDITQALIDAGDPNAVYFICDRQSGLVTHNGVQYDSFTPIYWETIRDKNVRVYLDLEVNTVTFRSLDGTELTIPIPSDDYKVVVMVDANEQSYWAEINLGTRPIAVSVDPGYSTLYDPMVVPGLYFEGVVENGYLWFNDNGVNFYIGKPWMIYTNKPFGSTNHVYWEFAMDGGTPKGAIYGMADFSLYQEGADPMTAIGACGYHKGLNKWVCDGVLTDLPEEVGTNYGIGLDYNASNHTLKLCYYSNTLGGEATVDVPLPAKNGNSDFRTMFGLTHDVEDTPMGYGSYVFAIGNSEWISFNRKQTPLPNNYITPVTWIPRNVSQSGGGN